jgi:hypothetical protein
LSTEQGLVETHRVWDDVRVDVPEESSKRALPSHPEDGRDAAPVRPDPARLRAADADRDRVADQLREALAEGRLSPEEHAERLDAVYAAKTYAELAPIVEDLPATGQPAAPPRQPAMQVSGSGTGSLPAPTRHSGNIVAIFSGAQRKGRWLVESHTTITAVFGGVDLDLRQAVLAQREVSINITCVFGGVDIKVPPGVRVVNSSVSVFGGVQLPDDDPLEPDAPVLRLTGLNVFGGVGVRRRPVHPDDAGALGGGEFRARHREIQREIQERRRDAHRELRDMRRVERRQRRRGG